MVHGADDGVIQGGAAARVDALQRFRPTLYFETLARYGDVHSGSNFRMIESFLTAQCGYELFRIAPGGEIHPVTERNLDDYTIAIHPARNS